LKIIYIVESKFFKRDYDIFGIDLLFRRGYEDIEVWDCSQWLRPNYFKSYSHSAEIFEKYVKKVPSEKSIEKLFQTLPEENIFICIFGINSKSSSIFNYLNKHQCKYGFTSFGHLPKYGMVKSIIKMLKRPIALKRLPSILNSRLNLIKFKYQAIESSIKPDFVIFGGKVASNKYVIKKTTIIKSHYLDYDSFLSLEKLPEASKNKRYAVFLDDFGPYHPDNTKKIDAKEYYTMINIFFDYMEKILDMDIVIAPHPRADYLEENPFNGRSIIMESTASIVKGSNIVITRNSTAVSYAVMYRKPIVFVDSDMFPYVERELGKSMADFFFKPVINMNALNFTIQNDFFFVNEKIYKSYHELYIKESNTPEKQSWGIFADYLDTFYV
jgi:hypothetical protein